MEQMTRDWYDGKSLKYVQFLCQIFVKKTQLQKNDFSKIEFLELI